MKAHATNVRQILFWYISSNFVLVYILYGWKTTTAKHEQREHFGQ